jgi:hypothetical protein
MKRWGGEKKLSRWREDSVWSMVAAGKQKMDEFERRDKTVTRIRNSRNLDTRNQQLDTRCNKNSTKQKQSGDSEKAKIGFRRG